MMSMCFVAYTLRTRTRRLEAVLGPRKSLRFDFFHIELDRSLDRACRTQKVLHEFRFLSGIDVEHVVEHEDLPVTIDAGADADRRAAHGRGDLFRERGRY